MERTLELVSKQSDEKIERYDFYEERPWGNFTILDEGHNFKVKRIEVLPLGHLSYQKHKYRTEHWFVVQGIAKVMLDERNFVVGVGEAIDVEVGAVHRVENPRDDETLVLIEIQRGSYLGEDDIIRFDDDFGRTEESAAA